MKIAETSLWILGTTLLASCFSAVYWGEHQRREELASLTEVRQPALDERRPVAHSREAPSAVAVPAAMLPVPDANAMENAVVAELRIPGIEFGTPDQTRVCRTIMLDAVGPGDVHVPDDSGAPTLMLVTCYPADSGGNAPNHYIMQAVVADSAR
jgi:hypothetical protein